MERGWRSSTLPIGRSEGEPISQVQIQLQRANDNYPLQLVNETNHEAEWELLYSNGEPKWTVSGLNESARYVFRVRAGNTFGWSKYSNASGPQDIATVLKFRQRDRASSGLIVGIAVPLLLLLCTICGLFVATLFRRPWEKKKPLPAGMALLFISYPHTWKSSLRR